jgi:beta-fructofuranosidase
MLATTPSPSTTCPTTTLTVQKVPFVSISTIALETNKELVVSKRWRPKHHIVAPRGWLNDPCAPGYDPVNDLYHVGFQWNPNSTEWGNISWGSAVSHDLLSWKVSDQPSMQPSPQHDPCGVFTGCLVPTAVDGSQNGVLTALYTSVSRLPIHYTQEYSRTSEAVALATSSDSGRTWKRKANNIIIAEPPTGVDVTGWRDPFVASWPSMDNLMADGSPGNAVTSPYAIVAGGIRSKTPTAFLYRVDTHDLGSWEYLGPLITPGLNFSPSSRWTGDFGVNWEVSNFLSLKTEDDIIARDFLVCGAEGRFATEDDKRTQGQMRTTTAQMWVCGKLEQVDGAYMTYQYGGILDHGMYYAGNSFWDPKTRRNIIFGWILEDDLEAGLRQEQGWAGVISLPRTLKLHVLRSVVDTISSTLRSIASIELIPDNPSVPSFTIVSLCAVPDSRLRKLRGRKVALSNDPTRSSGTHLFFPSPWAQWEMELEFSYSEHSKKLGFDIKHSPSEYDWPRKNSYELTEIPAEYTRIYFEPSSETIVVDRSQSSHQPGIRRCQERAPHTLFVFGASDKDSSLTKVRTVEPLKFHVLYDCSVLQIFANERTAITTRVYPASGTSIAVLPFVDNDSTLPRNAENLSAWNLNLWPLSIP